MNTSSTLLALDTCGPESTLALCRLSSTELTLLDQSVLAPRTAAQELTTALGSLLARCSLTPAELGAVLAVDGPGSFTGIRLGLATAKALTQACGMPLYTISRLVVLAHTHGAVAAALDAGRAELFLLAPDSSGHPVERLAPVSEAAVLGPELLLCEPKLLAALPHARLVAQPSALSAAQAAYPKLLRSPAQDPATLEGRYLRTELYGKAR